LVAELVQHPPMVRFYWGSNPAGSHNFFFFFNFYFFVVFYGAWRACLGHLAPASWLVIDSAKTCLYMKTPWPSSSGLRGRRKTYLTILELAYHALPIFVCFSTKWCSCFLIIFWLIYQKTIYQNIFWLYFDCKIATIKK
jgi:hypothetical protein